ncbi:hypothetical protein B4O97_12180 [Marispirochaeta aestuarii]|jgi:hypothetical protein|uniref:Uncharacterized protein n=1 Tax=Marispirochaeta aestuarii TaxID=1963862 RepID=A0A1Y1RWU6_9SPIO|nr:hypothetical protein [Marispirochaeta aestuarii]ORC34694.1 hypothetical protein B4O97_12180 [Marispirochaeta aestuarii]
MTLSLRNAIILLGAGFNLLLLAGFCLSLSLLVPFPAGVTEIREFLGTLASVYNADLIFLFILQLTSLISSLVLYKRFRKTASPEIFFFILFLLSMGIEGARVFPPALRELQVPVYLYQLVIRLLYMARFFGIFSLFTAGLFANGMQYQKVSIAYGISLLTAFTLSSLLPVAEASLQTDTGLDLVTIGDVSIVMITLRILAVINFLVAWIRNNSRDFLWLGLGGSIVLFGYDLALGSEVLWLRIVAAAGIIVGINLFSRRTHEIYLWI